MIVVLGEVKYLRLQKLTRGPWSSMLPKSCLTYFDSVLKTPWNVWFLEDTEKIPVSILKTSNKIRWLSFCRKGHRGGAEIFVLCTWKESYIFKWVTNKSSPYKQQRVVSKLPGTVSCLWLCPYWFSVATVNPSRLPLIAFPMNNEHWLIERR